MIWDPFEDLARMHEEMDRLFNRSFGTRPLLGSPKGKELSKYQGLRTPVSDVKETDKSVIATFELPGADKKEIELNVTHRAIEVKVQKKTENEVKKKGFYSYESASKQYYRAIPLPTEVHAEKAEASYKDGLLRIEIPKAKQIPSKKRILIK